MGKLNLSYQNLNKALKTLKKAILAFNDIEKLKSWNEENKLQFSNYEDMRDQLRDSTTQRFEYCTDLFWKYLKNYLEFYLHKPVEISSPKMVIKTACKTEMISESDTTKLINMIKDRNETSHIYKEEMAEDLIVKIPEYYKLMHKYAAILTP